jgi:hypothetical protein
MTIFFCPDDEIQTTQSPAFLVLPGGACDALYLLDAARPSGNRGAIIA